jgi:hypothetical protein
MGERWSEVTEVQVLEVLKMFRLGLGSKAVITRLQRAWPA